MGREVRKVPADWVHPQDDNGEDIPLYEGNAQKELARWMECREKWLEGLRENYGDGPKWVPIDGTEGYRYTDYAGPPPNPDDYMPDFGDSATHLQMYETCTEGTPISPVMETPEELARWLEDNGASAFADMTATYDQWLSTINSKTGSAPSAVISDGRLESGVAATERN